jgi:hypothetical protein
MSDDGTGSPASRARAVERVTRPAAAGPVATSPSWLLSRAGALGQRARSSVWVHGASPAQFAGALRLLREIMRERPHVRLVLTSSDPATVVYLRRAFPDDFAGAAPWGTGGAVRRFLARVNPRLLVVLDGGRSLAAGAVDAVTARHLPLAVVVSDAGTEPAPHVARALRTSGARGRRVAPTDDSPAAALRAAAALRDLLPESPALPRVRQAWRVPSFRDRVGQSGAWARAATLLSGRRIDEPEALRARLGAPRSILVLGNGPSSEDPRLAGIAHDCLMRVNWRWQTRGLFVRPQLVFAGDPATMTRLDGTIFGFWNVALERAMLLRRLATRGPWPVEFVTMERLSPVIRDLDWPARPTNGALAVLAAATLQPERLVVAGIDLFRHPDGRYPGEAQARNDYSHVHEMETDLGIMELALRDYTGELIVLSDILRDALAARSAAAEVG